MITKNQVKLVTSLREKKFREREGMFFAEGEKVVKEMIESGIRIEYIFCTEEQSAALSGYESLPLYIVNENEIKKISSLSTPPGILAVAKIPEQKDDLSGDDLILALDEIRDPGNLGTIIRLADWFGVKNILCSKGTADVYNPKVIQSTMGSFLRVKVHYGDLVSRLRELSKEFRIYGTFLEGKNIYKTEFQKRSVIVIGNESNGISPEVEKVISEKITIPSFGKGAESLNAAMAASVVCTLFRKER